MADVELYSWRYCPYCIRAKALLQRKGVTFREYAIDGDHAARRAMTQRAGGRATLPQIFINQVPIGGCDELMALERAGRLDALLGMQGAGEH